MYLTYFHFYSSKIHLYSKPVKGLQGYGLSYRFQFNGMERDNETYGEGNTYDYEARIYDPRIGRFLSIDQHTHKYPWLSPYSAFANSPIILTDNNGKDNVIYLIALPSASPHLNKTQVNDIIKQANQNFLNMGLKTRVVLADPEKFDMSKLTKTDAVAVLGEKKEVTDYVKTNLDSKFAIELKNDWLPKGDVAPEMSENNKGAGSGNNVIALDAKAIKASPTEYSVGDETNGMVKFGALSINHGAGHNAGQNHEDEPGGEATNSVIMKSGRGLAANLSNPKSTFPMTDSLIPNTSTNPSIKNLPTRNSDYVDAMKNRFGNRSAKYNKQQTSSTSK
jgi:RHS repeat-associated protein